MADSHAEFNFEHLIVFQHGLEGSVENWCTYIEKFKAEFGDRIFVHCAHLNEKPGTTWTGIDSCGQRLAEEVLAVKTEVWGEKAKRVKLSLIGHSLGGLIIRYAIGHLLDKNLLATHFDPQAVITFASPHCGSRRPKKSLFDALVNFTLGSILQATGKQLGLNDTELNGKPLLRNMADPDLPYYKALQMFKRFVTYANVTGDLSVPYSTSAITYKNPYRPKHNKIVCSKKYPHIVEKPLAPPPISVVLSSEDHRQEPQDDEESKLFEGEVLAEDRKGEDLRYIVSNLQNLKREHFDAYFEGIPVAHFMIINVPPPLPGDDVVQHCLDRFVL